LGLTVLMAEQNFNQAIKIADRGYVIVHGEIAFEGKTAEELRNNELVKRLYFGKRRAAIPVDGRSDANTV
jgi:branched-chain amino acid transport system ATP-binding protein